MKVAVISGYLAAVLTAQGQELFDRLADTLTFTAFDDNVRAKISGTFDLEGYHFDQPPPGLINSSGDGVVAPRLSLFLDVQAGSQIYVFAQARFDRGFDPSDRGAEARLDEYAARITPWNDGRFSLQIGKFATVVGNFVPRHLSWDNPFVTAPLIYENVTALQDFTGYLPPNYQSGSRYSKYNQIPVIWGPSYASGASVAGRIGMFDYAAEVKNASLSSRPETWDVTQRGFDNPTVSARAGFRPNQMWNFGISVSNGAYLQPQATPHLPRGTGVDDYREKVIGQDLGFAWHHLQIWAEVYEARFEVPYVGDANTVGYYLEAKYKFAPQFSAALRWNQQLFDSVQTYYGPVSLGADIWRLDAAATYRLTAQIQLKLQYSFQQETTGAQNENHLFAGQLTIRF